MDMGLQGQTAAKSKRVSYKAESAKMTMHFPLVRQVQHKAVSKRLGGVLSSLFLFIHLLILLCECVGMYVCRFMSLRVPGRGCHGCTFLASILFP